MQKYTAMSFWRESCYKRCITRKNYVTWIYFEGKNRDSVYKVKYYIEYQIQLSRVGYCSACTYG